MLQQLTELPLYILHIVANLLEYFGKFKQKFANRELYQSQKLTNKATLSRI